MGNPIHSLLFGQLGLVLLQITILVEGGIGGFWIPQHRKKLIRTPHHRKKSWQNTDTAIYFQIYYMAIWLFENRENVHMWYNILQEQRQGCPQLLK